MMAETASRGDDMTPLFRRRMTLGVLAFLLAVAVVYAVTR